MSNFFNILDKDRTTAARTGIIRTAHGDILTPEFIPVGTAAAVKTLTPLELKDAGAQAVMGNTYHLMQHPGVDVVGEGGRLARFMGWKGPTLTDSGGFQVFSLSATRKVTEDGVEFRSVYNGELLSLTPESVLELQRGLGADIIYALDECTPYPSTNVEVARAVSLTTRWAERFMAAHRNADQQGEWFQAPILVVQGGVYEDLRRQSVEQLAELEPSGFGIGGLSVGEPQNEMIMIAGRCCEWLPDEKPRHLMGVGTPGDMISAVEAGVDLFDCVLPTRNGRNGQAFTSRGVVNIRNAHYRTDRACLDPGCRCYTCHTFTRSYLHHLFASGELLGMRLLSLHNITYYLNLMREARTAIRVGHYRKWKKQIEAGWEEEA